MLSCHKQSIYEKKCHANFNGIFSPGVAASFSHNVVVRFLRPAIALNVPIQTRAKGKRKICEQMVQLSCTSTHWRVGGPEVSQRGDRGNTDNIRAQCHRVYERRRCNPTEERDGGSNAVKFVIHKTFRGANR